MHKQLSINTTICSQYQKLLEECQSALETWNDHRAEVCNSRVVGKEAGNELLRLQAKFARAYTMLQNHAHNCLRRQLVSKIESFDSEDSSDSSLAARKPASSSPFRISNETNPRVPSLLVDQ